MDELLDIVDDYDNVIGQLWRSEIYKARDKYTIRGVWLFIKNDQGQLWIPRRSFNKKLLPGALDASACGHVGANESYSIALHREVLEELNIDLSKVDYKEIAYISPKIATNKLFTKVYILSMNEAPDYNKEDFIEYFWLTPKDLLKKINDGEIAKNYLPIIVSEIFIDTQ